jgi:hypothetical protein
MNYKVNAIARNITDHKHALDNMSKRLKSAAVLAIILCLTGTSESVSQVDQSSIALSVGRIRNLQYDIRQSHHSPYAEIEYAHSLTFNAVDPAGLSASIFLGAWHEPDYIEFWDSCWTGCEYESHSSMIVGTRGIIELVDRSVGAAFYVGLSSHFVWSEGARRRKSGELDFGDFFDVIGGVSTGAQIEFAINQSISFAGRIGHTYYVGNDVFRINTQDLLAFQLRVNVLGATTSSEF